jgi:hypothetical protein
MELRKPSVRELGARLEFARQYVTVPVGLRSEDTKGVVNCGKHRDKYYYHPAG